MSTHALRQGARESNTFAGAQAAAPIASPRSDRSGRRPPHSYEALQRLSDRLDGLLRDVAIGARSQREDERHCHEAEAIAAGLRAAFRGPAAEPVNPPAWQHSANGRSQAAW